ncbi:uncharacterized protein [Palaemon carinicauda]|uniref:uncharacterized protein n=1 Tax=Palaemon carinicauda TaxID=392227 RepID=UPI0035B5C097
MFPRTLILVAISAAFASGIPPPISECDIITEILQMALSPLDPQTFPIIPNVNYIRDYVRYNLDFFHLVFAGFSRVNCNHFNASGQPLNNVGVSQQVTQELNDHPDAVVEAINIYLSRFVNDPTAILNYLLCIDYP